MKIFDLSEENLLEVFNQIKNIFEGKEQISFRLIYVQNFFEARRFFKENRTNVHSIQTEEGESGYSMSQTDPHAILSLSFLIEGDKIIFEDHNNNRRYINCGDAICITDDFIFHSRKIKNKIVWEVWE